MTKESYFEMCEMLNEEPLEENIPIEYDDFPELVQQILTMYWLLEDRWDTMGGHYLGKNYSTIFNLLSLYSIDSSEALLAIDLLKHIDSIRSDIIAEKLKAKSPTSK